METQTKQMLQLKRELLESRELGLMFAMARSGVILFMAQLERCMAWLGVMFSNVFHGSAGEPWMFG